MVQILYSERELSIKLLLGEKTRKKTNISPFPATHTYIKLTFVSFFFNFFLHLSLTHKIDHSKILRVICVCLLRCLETTSCALVLITKCLLAKFCLQASAVSFFTENINYKVQCKGRIQYCSHFLCSSWICKILNKLYVLWYICQPLIITLSKELISWTVGIDCSLHLLQYAMPREILWVGMRSFCLSKPKVVRIYLGDLVWRTLSQCTSGRRGGHFAIASVKDCSSPSWCQSPRERTSAKRDGF